MSDRRGERALYPIGVVEEKTGLTARQIRYYEKKGLIAPRRSEGKQRLFSEEDISRLRAVQELREEGYPLSRITAVLEREFEAATRGEAPDLDRYPAADGMIRRRLASLYPLRNREALLPYLEREERE